MKCTALILILLTAGCAAHTRVQVSAGSPHSGVQVYAEGGRGLAVLLGLSILASGIYEMERIDGPQAAPELAPDRRISEQDCTRPLDYSLGNIRCK